ncbi:MAG: type II secretion system F family protein [Armatimonadetes bacterium]|nr:type II secretion system F family protein [Armatimonadota bacterium]
MKTYQYRCRDSQGTLHEGLLDADSRDAARAMLQERGWAILSLSHGFRASVAAAQASAPPAKTVVASAPEPDCRWTAQQLTLFTLKLGTLLGSGVSIVRALECLAEGEDPAVYEVVTGLLARILKGERLSGAMASYPGVFAAPYQSLIRLGEDTGALVKIVARMAESLRRLESHRARLTAALTYPLFVLVAVGLMSLLLALYMVPQLNHLLVQMGVEMPWLTRAVVALTDPRAMLGAASCALLLGLWLAAARRTPAGKAQLDRLWFELPGLGPVTCQALEIRLSRGLSMMLDAGMSWSRAAELLATPSCGYPFYDESLRQLKVEIESGDFRNAVQRCGAFSPMMAGLILAGAEVNKAGRFLDTYADLAEIELEMTLDTLIHLLEPAVLLFMGAFVGVVVIAAFLPVYELLLTL